MTRAEALDFVRNCSEDEGPDSPEEAAEIFAAIYGRQPDDEDGEVWSHCCAAVQS